MGRNAWSARLWAGGALLCAGLASWRLLLSAGMSVYRTDVIVIGGVALVLGAGWVWSGSRPLRLAPPRQIEPVPPPPARLPRRRLRLLMPWLLGVAVILPALAVVTELALRPDGADLKRIAAIQKAGAEVAEGRIVFARRLAKEDPKVPYYSGDVTVELAGKGSVEVVNGHFGRRWDLDQVHEMGRTMREVTGPPGKPVQVLYAPTRPDLGGVVDTKVHLDRYEEADSVLALTTPNLVPQIALVPGAILLIVWMVATWGRADQAARRLRADAADGEALPAVRARITAARRTDHTSFGTVNGTVRVTSDRRLCFTLEDGSEVLAGGGDTAPDGLALLAARLRERPGWLLGARNWRFIRDGQPVVFVTDEGEVAWLTMDREDFERVLASAPPVRPDPQRRTALLPAPTTVVPRAHWPWLGGLLLSYALAVLVLAVPMSWGAALAASLLAGAVPLAAWALRSRLSAEHDRRPGRWEIRETRDPELGPV
ncbi:hypothetical protein OTB20_23970 [Streptomyces sp. H27-H1]|uniref:hypothetical protein n=1 Tax=Streptomyces sp. H27-H1 TaxID=2996461 RepID=UPI00226D947B|nr:hypothetical protein [Streptomyces sp. H27-H1]MCY0929199.1 hypothetical protein [Streptomyces sp. H27-H1]